MDETRKLLEKELKQVNAEREAYRSYWVDARERWDKINDNMQEYTTRIHRLEQEMIQLDVLESLAQNSGHSMKDGLAFGAEDQR